MFKEASHGYVCVLVVEFIDFSDTFLRLCSSRLAPSGMPGMRLRECPRTTRRRRTLNELPREIPTGRTRTLPRDLRNEQGSPFANVSQKPNVSSFLLQRFRRRNREEGTDIKQAGNQKHEHRAIADNKKSLGPKRRGVLDIVGVFTRRNYESYIRGRHSKRRDHLACFERAADEERMVRHSQQHRATAGLIASKSDHKVVQITLLVQNSAPRKSLVQPISFVIAGLSRQESCAVMLPRAIRTNRAGIFFFFFLVTFPTVCKS